MNGGGSNTEIVDLDSEPWAPARKYLIDQLGLSQDRFNDPQEFFPGQTVGGRSGDSALAFDLTRELAQNNPARDAANSFIGQVAGGDFMPGAANNSYLDETFDVMSKRIGESFNQIQMPTINSRFAGAGRSGSQAAGRARGRADETLARELGDLGTEVYYGDYERRTGDRFKAVAAQGDLERQQFGAIGALAASGADQENYTQRLLNDAIQRFQFGQQEPDARLDAYIQRIRGSSAGYGTQQQAIGGQPTGSGTGAAIAGAGSFLGPIIGSLIGG